jgi:hypothetical protein
MRSYYIIEHPTRGVLRDIEHNDDGYLLGRFSWSAGRADAGVLRYNNLSTAHDARASLPASVCDACAIRISETWDVVA